MVHPNDETAQENSPFVEHTSSATRDKVREETVDKIRRDPTHSVFPITPPKIRRTLMDAKSNAVGARAESNPGLERSQVLENVTDKELVERTKGYMYGKWCEAFSNTIELNKADTIFIGKSVDTSIFNGAEIRTPANSLSTNRKDFAIMALFAESVEITGRNNRPENEDIVKDAQDRKKIARQVRNFILSQDQILNDQRDDKDINASNVDVKTLFKDWWSKSEIARQMHFNKYGAEGTKYAEACLDEAIEIVKHKDKDLNPYFDYVLPDSFIVATSGEVLVPVEVKAYSEEEVRVWIDGLKKIADDARVLPTLKVQAMVGNETMNLGFEPAAELRFIELMNFVRYEHGDDGSFEHFYEKLAVAEPGEYPILLRLTEDIPDKMVEELGIVCGKMGFTNLIIQKLPFTRTELGICARFYCNENLSQLESFQIAGRAVPQRDKRIYATLAKDKTWGFE